MIRKLFILIFIASLSINAQGVCLSTISNGDDDTTNPISPKDIIFEHLGDGYGWEVPFNHHHRIPLPVILFGDNGFDCFSSSKVTGGNTYCQDGKEFVIATEGKYEGKVVQILPDGQQYRPYDISITKNVCGLLIACVLVLLSLASLVRWYNQKKYKAPTGYRGAVEALVEFVYNGVIKPILEEKTSRFAPYLLTVFFLILFLNLLGLIVVFPGGANLTGNIAITLVLAIFTFLFTNVFGTKHYWKDIFWPDVPLFLKFPLPIMPLIEIFGMFTKPAALTVRLFANMMGGHMIVIVLTLLIFIFAVFGPMVTGASTIVSVLFSLFMLAIDVLVSFIQAYVFTMLSTIFIGLAQEEGHKAHEKNESAIVMSK